MSFTAAHFHVTTAQFVINCTLKYALLSSCLRLRSSDSVTCAIRVHGPPTATGVLPLQAHKCGTPCQPN